MVSDQKQISVIFDRDLIHHSFYDYLTTCQKNQIIERCKQGKTLICGVYQNGKHLFNASFDIDHADILHCRDVAGDFGRNLDHLYRTALVIAKGMKKDFITVNATRRAVVKFCERLGFEHVQDNEYQKVI